MAKYQKKTKKIEPIGETNGTEEVVEIPTLTPPSDIVTINKADWEQIQNQLKMLTAVADKGRVFNYESSRAEKKPMKINLSTYNGKILVGWSTLKDKSIFHPTTGKQVGEEQEYELEFLNSEGSREKIIINGYPQFSNMRYDNRIECEVVGKKEDYNGKIDFSVVLPDGREITINSAFIN
jgi:hypothetical protein